MKKEKTLAAIRPNEGLEAAYRKRLDVLVDDMYASVFYWLHAGYRKNTPELAQDASPAKALQAIIAKLGKQWQGKFDDEAPNLAKWFVQSAQSRVDKTMATSLKGAGISVKFSLTRAMNDVLQATNAENVGLIRSISSEFFTDIEGMVMRSVAQGRDIGTLAKDLEHTYGVTKRRAAFIAQSQNNMATAAIVRTRQEGLGITRARWKHSAGGKHPRPEHVAANGQIYEIKKGMFLEGVWTWPGTEINCLPADAVVGFGNGCKKLWRNRYSGNLTLLVTASGKTLKSTPNHPILTRRGWVSAKNVHVGDDVISIGDKVFGGVKENVERSEATFSKVFNTISALVRPDATWASLPQFHGDIVDSEVETIDIDSLLPSEIDAHQAKAFCEFIFTGAEVPKSRISLPPERALYEVVNCLFNAPDSIMSGFCSIVTLLLSHSASANDVGQRLATKFYSLLRQSATDGSPIGTVLFRECENTHSNQIIFGDGLIGKLLGLLSRSSPLWQVNSPSDEALLDRLIANPIGFRCGHQSRAADHHFDSIVEIREIDYSGHVYDLESHKGWYTNFTCIVHNCRCVSQSVIEALED